MEKNLETKNLETKNLGKKDFEKILLQKKLVKNNTKTSVKKEDTKPKARRHTNPWQKNTRTLAKKCKKKIQAKNAKHIAKKKL